MSLRWKLGLATGGVLALGLAVLHDELEAQPPGRAIGRVAVLDVVSIFNQYRQTADINGQLEQRRLEVQRELDARDEKIEIKARELEAFHPDSADYGKRRRELLRMRIDRDTYMRLAEIEVRDLFTVWTRRTYDEICSLAGQMAKEQGYEVIIAREDLQEDIPDANALKQQIRLRKVIYADPGVDLTEAVLARLNREYEQKGKKPELGLLGF